jgi:hypothetical protein
VTRSTVDTEDGVVDHDFTGAIHDDLVAARRAALHSDGRARGGVRVHDAYNPLSIGKVKNDP